jgi:hypothetical protein
MDHGGLCSCLSFFDCLPLAALVHFALPPVRDMLEDDTLGGESHSSTQARFSAVDSTESSSSNDMCAATHAQAQSEPLAQLQSINAAACTPDSVPKKRRRNSVATPSALGLRIGEPLFAPVLMGPSIAEEGSWGGDSPARTPSSKQPSISTCSGGCCLLHCRCTESACI